MEGAATHSVQELRAAANAPTEFRSTMDRAERVARKVGAVQAIVILIPRPDEGDARIVFSESLKETPEIARDMANQVGLFFD